MKLYGFSTTDTDVVIKEHVGMPAERIVCKVPITGDGWARENAAHIMQALTLVDVIRDLIGTL